MLPPRRFLPSLSLLSAFESAARTGSVTAAARELNLTQGAVSRQIKALEQQLQVQLFVRERQTIRLTMAGESYAREVRESLRKITTASLNLRANPFGGMLNIGVLPTLGERWLAPRLPRFVAANPGVMLNLMTRTGPVDFRLESLDAAIHFGDAEWSGVQMALLRTEYTMPMCSPEILRDRAFATAADLRSASLLHLTTRPDAWEQWFSANGESTDGVHGMLFDQLATMAESAAAGLGVALLPTFLFEQELANGKLVHALTIGMQSRGRYFIVWPPDRATYPPLVAFRDWLLTDTAADR